MHQINIAKINTICINYITSYILCVCSQLCPDDHHIETELIDQRIAETCQNLIDGGVLDPEKYLPSGAIYTSISKCSIP